MVEEKSLLGLYMDAGPVWDGKARLRGLPYTHLNIEDHKAAAYTSDVLVDWMVSAIRRAYCPGSKADICPIFYYRNETPRGNFVMALCPEWVESVGELFRYESKKGIYSFCRYSDEQRRGLVAIPVSGPLRPSEKELVSATEDVYRRPYESDAVRRPRSFVFYGATNERYHLTEVTGNRRFPFIDLGLGFNYERVLEDRAQLWAEALVMFKTEACNTIPAPLVTEKV